MKPKTREMIVEVLTIKPDRSYVSKRKRRVGRAYAVMCNFSWREEDPFRGTSAEGHDSLAWSRQSMKQVLECVEFCLKRE